jgi:hypothetical protein
MEPGARGSFRAVLCQEAGARIQRARGDFRAVLCQEAGAEARAQGARGSFRAVLCQETRAKATGHVAVPELPRGLVAGAGATRHVAAPELPCARRREPRDTWTCASVLSFVLTWSLYMGVSGLQGTDSDPRAHLGRGCEPTGRTNIISRAAFLSFIHWDFKPMVQCDRYVAAHDSRGTLRCSDRLAEPSRVAPP